MGAAKSTESKVDEFTLKSPKGKKHARVRRFEGCIDASEARALAQDVLVALMPTFKKMAESGDRVPSTHELYPAAYRIVTRPTKVTIGARDDADLVKPRVVLTRLTLAREEKGIDELRVAVVDPEAFYEADIDASPEGPVFCVAYVEKWFPVDRSEGTRLEVFVRACVQFEAK